jgi:hypothetical protein
VIILATSFLVGRLGDLGKLFGDLLQDLGPQAADHLLPFPLDPDDVGGFEFVKVMGDRGGDLFDAGDVAADFARGWAFDTALIIDRGASAAHLGKEFHDVQSGRVGKRFHSLCHHFASHRNDDSIHFEEMRNVMGITWV